MSAGACDDGSGVFEEAVFIEVTLSYCKALHESEQKRGAELLLFGAQRLDVRERDGSGQERAAVRERAGTGGAGCAGGGVHWERAAVLECAGVGGNVRRCGNALARTKAQRPAFPMEKHRRR